MVMGAKQIIILPRNRQHFSLTHPADHQAVVVPVLFSYWFDGRMTEFILLLLRKEQKRNTTTTKVVATETAVVDLLLLGGWVALAGEQQSGCAIWAVEIYIYIIQYLGMNLNNIFQDNDANAS